MFCARCGTACRPDHKFCKRCGAPVGAASSAQAVAAPVIAPVASGAASVQPVPPPPPAAPAAYPGAYQNMFQGGYQGAPALPPGMVPVLYQAYPGGPQQVYYVPAHGAQAHGGGGFLEGIRAKIRDLASTDKLEGFSLRRTFSQAFSKHSEGEIEEYMMVGASRTTPPLELVETGWPRPWMFFRMLTLFVVATVVLYAVWKFTGNTPMVPAVLIMGAFAVPVATLMLIFEMNTPRNVSLVTVGRLFVMGGLAALCAVSFEYMLPIAAKFPGIVEETAKLAMVLAVMRSMRYKYELNGILFGAAVGAGFAAFETTFYGLINAFLPTLIHDLQQMQAGHAIDAAMQAMVDNLILRGILAPFGHVVWTAIAAGAFWRVKGAQPTNMSMLSDSRFLTAFFAIPVLMHTLWDIGIDFPQSALLNSLLVEVGGWIVTGSISWYVLFGLVQQGLRQVRDEQKTHLQSTLVNVEATLGLGAKAYAMQPQRPASA